MLVDGAIIIAVYEEEEGGCFLERSPQDILVAPITKKEVKGQSIMQGVIFIHHRQVRPIGSSGLDPQNMRIVLSSSGPQAIFCIKKHHDTLIENYEDDIRSVGSLLRILWTKAGSLDPIEEDLMDRMISANPPPSKTVLNDLAFCIGGRMLLFLSSVSDILELKQKKHRDSVEKDRQEIFGDSWLDKLEPELQLKVEKEKRRKFDKTLIRDLLRLIRNLSTHHHTLAPELRIILDGGEDLSRFWVKRFPLLLPAVLLAMKEFAADTNCKSIQQFYF